MNLTFSIFSSDNIRLDKLLSLILKTSRREIAYLLKEGYITVNNKKIVKSYIAEKGDLISVKKENNLSFDYDELKIVYENRNMLFIYKPPFFHSAETRGSIRSVENFLKTVNENYILLNRLDFKTEGFLICAKNNLVEKKIKELTNKLKVEKYYYAFIEGKLEREINISNKLKSKNKKTVVVLKDSVIENKTILKPVAIYNNMTFAEILIYKGSRHQIRALCAYKGYVLAGDIDYGSKLNLNRYFLFCAGYKIKSLNFQFFEFNFLKRSFGEFLRLANDKN